jgi:hypothetical protein
LTFTTHTVPADDSLGIFPGGLRSERTGKIMHFSAGYLDWRPPGEAGSRCPLCSVRAASVDDRCLECWLVLDRFDEHGVVSPETMRLHKIRFRGMRESTVQ